MVADFGFWHTWLLMTLLGVAESPLMPTTMQLLSSYVPVPWLHGNDGFQGAITKLLDTIIPDLDLLLYFKMGAGTLFDRGCTMIYGLCMLLCDKSVHAQGWECEKCTESKPNVFQLSEFRMLWWGIRTRMLVGCQSPIHAVWPNCGLCLGALDLFSGKWGARGVKDAKTGDLCSWLGVEPSPWFLMKGEEVKLDAGKTTRYNRKYRHTYGHQCWWKYSWNSDQDRVRSYCRANVQVFLHVALCCFVWGWLAGNFRCFGTVSLLHLGSIWLVLAKSIGWITQCIRVKFSSLNHPCIPWPTQNPMLMTAIDWGLHSSGWDLPLQSPRVWYGDRPEDVGGGMWKRVWGDMLICLLLMGCLQIVWPPKTGHSAFWCFGPGRRMLSTIRVRS